MAQQLSAFLLAEDLGLIPSTSMMAHNHLLTPVPRVLPLFF